MDKTEVKVTVFDHTVTAVNAERIINAGKKSCITVTRVYSVDEVTSKIGLVHPEDDKQWNSIINFAKAGDIRVRMSTVGRLGAQPGPIGTENVLALELIVPPQDLSEDEWRLILEGFSNATLVRELTKSGDAKGLRRYFFSIQAEQLISLAILCQGYLAVYASEHGTSTDVEYKDIEPTLRHLGWHALDEKVRVKFLSVLADKTEHVRAPRWWLSVFGLWDNDDGRRVTDDAKWREFEQVVGREWQMLGASEMANEVRTLLSLLRNKDDKNAKDEIGPPRQVAQAYCAIVSCLSRSL